MPSKKTPPRMLLFVPDRNSPGKVDVTGAFLPEARAFARHWGADPERVIYRFPAVAPGAQRRAACAAAFDTADVPLELVGFFCHGWRDGLQCGFNRQSMLVLARLVARYASAHAHVLLYACQTGRDADADAADDIEPGPGGDGGFADELRDALEALGRQVTVMGHTTSGHCSYNPFARYFAPGRGGKGGHWYVEPESPLWQPWRRALRDSTSSLRLRFWGMTPAEIEAELSAGSGPLVA